MVNGLYEIELECIKEGARYTASKGDKTTIAYVKNKGLACLIRIGLVKHYKPEFFKINIK